uniref:Uncharacterized protein n=1 Tax=Setaria italica TaxID=4555 RepID=K3YYI1_SETIT
MAVDTLQQETSTQDHAIGYVIAWPHSHVKKATSTNLKQLGDITFQGRSEAAMERGKNGQ